MTRILIDLARPNEGEDVEHLSDERYAQAVQNYMTKHFEGYTFRARVYDNDGTGADSIENIDGQSYELMEATLVDAVSEAFCDPANYDMPATERAWADDPAHWAGPTTE